MPRQLRDKDTDDSVVAAMEKKIQDLTLKLQEDTGLTAKVDMMCASIRTIATDVIDIKESQNFSGLQMEEIRESLAKMDCVGKENRREIQELKVANNKLELEFQCFRYKQEELIAKLKEKNVILRNVPFQQGEVLNHIICKIANAVGFALEKENVIATRRFKGAVSSSKPGVVQVEFASKEIGFAFAKEIKAKRLSTDKVGFGGRPEAIYVSEDLSPFIASLFAKARDYGKKLSYKFVWVRASKIFMKKKEDSVPILIRDVSDLERLV